MCVYTVVWFCKRLHVCTSPTLVDICTAPYWLEAAGWVPVERRLTMFAATVKNDSISAYLLCSALAVINIPDGGRSKLVPRTNIFPILIMNGKTMLVYSSQNARTINSKPNENSVPNNACRLSLLSVLQLPLIFTAYYAASCISCYFAPLVLRDIVKLVRLFARLSVCRDA